MKKLILILFLILSLHCSGQTDTIQLDSVKIENRTLRQNLPNYLKLVATTSLKAIVTIEIVLYCLKKN